MNTKCPCCRKNINKFSKVLNDNLKFPLNKQCTICLNNLRDSSNMNGHLVSCPECGILYHLECINEYINRNSNLQSRVRSYPNLPHYNNRMYRENTISENVENQRIILIPQIEPQLRYSYYNIDNNIINSARNLIPTSENLNTQYLNPRTVIPNNNEFYRQPSYIRYVLH